jgi:lysophospholipase L1-like esterase
MRKLSSIAAILALMFTPSTCPAQPPEKDDGRFFFFKDGDTIVVMGDSITEQHLYSNYLEMWSVCRFPKRNLTFRNVGIGGDGSTGGNSRFKRDVLAHKATALTVDFGMNDGNYKPFDEKTFQVYMKGLQGIADQAKAAKIRVAWITPQPIEKKEQGSALQGYNETLERFSDGVRDIADKNGGVFVDQFHPYLAVLAKARATDPKNVDITVNEKSRGDAVHPGAPGQVVMAASILKRLDFQRLIARVEIDGMKVDAENCVVKDLNDTPSGTFSFSCLPSGLPFFPEEAKSILTWSPILDDMNRYWLTVKHLKPGRYEVQIDGQKIAEFSAEQLGKRVNLAGPALSAGPIADQVKKVWTAVQDKNRYFHDQIFRGVVLADAKNPIFKDVDPKDREAKRQEVYAERMQKMPELDAAVRQALEMKAHTVTIAPLTK